MGLIKNLKRIKTSMIVYKIYQNWRMGRHYRSGLIKSTHGSTHRNRSIADSLRYIDEQFSDYLTYSGLSKPDLLSKRVLELGFGDNVGVALRFLANGAEEVVCLDKFYSERDERHEQEIYEAVRSSLSSEERERFDTAISLTEGTKFNDQKLSCLNGLSVEEFAETIHGDRERFDMIVSRAVVEEVYDPGPLFTAVDRLLKPGGYMIHIIDLTDYGMFRDNGMHPLTFLTIHEKIYRLMATNTGLPNRKRVVYYRQKMSDLGYEAKLFVTSVIGKHWVKPHKEHLEFNVDYTAETLGIVRSIKAKLQPEFKNLPDEDLIVDGLFLVARKPAARPA